MEQELILITGGAGYIGSHVNRRLHQQGYATVVFDNLERGHASFVRWGNLVEGDLRHLEQVRELFDCYRISTVMHFAAFAYVGESMADPMAYYRNNVLGTMNLLQAMVEAGTDRLVFSSTCAVYGHASKMPIEEDHPRLPANPYGNSKLMAEKMIEDCCRIHGFKAVSLRYFNAAGAAADRSIGEWHEPETHLIPLVLDVAAGKREKVQIFGTDYPTQDGTCVRDYIHVDDLADAHCRALDYLDRAEGFTAFNLGCADGYSVRQVVAAAERVTGRQIPVEACARRPGDPASLMGSFAKARRVLGWQPVYTDLDEIVATAWQWHQTLDVIKKRERDIT